MMLDTRMSQLRQVLAEYETAPPPGLERWLPRRDGAPGKCFQEAEGVVLSSADSGAGLLLVHGKCRGPNGELIDHAWVEVPGELVYDAVLGRVYPQDVYQGLLQAVAQRRYSAKQVKVLVRTADNHGPWTEAEEQRAFTLL
jgi:hypothetical protein